MEIDRLPTSPTEKPQLMGCYDREKNVVHWAIDSEAFYTSEMFMDGTDWFYVWRVDNAVHCRATQWFHSRGDFCLRVTDLIPDQAVAMASQAATIASNYFDGNTKLEEIS